MKIREKFPCGYEIEIKTSFIDSFNIDKGNYNSGICPIHGKDCPPKELVKLQLIMAKLKNKFREIV